MLITDNETSATRLREISGNLDVYAINDTDDSPFARFELRSAYVFDNCGHLVYVIHYPWSTVMRPFIKAATLSTMYDGPCGECERTDVSVDHRSSRQFRIFISWAVSHFQNNTIIDYGVTALPNLRINKKPTPANAVAEIDPILVNADIQSPQNAQSSTTIAPTVSLFDKTTSSTSGSRVEFPVQSSAMPVYSDINKNAAFKLNASTLHAPNRNADDDDDDGESTDSQSDEAYAIPLKIILPVPHVHAFAPENGTFQRFNYILLKVNDSAFHEHFAYDKPLHLFPVSDRTVDRSTTTPTSVDSTSEQDSVTETQTTPFDNDNEIYRNDQSTKDPSDMVVLTDSEGYRYQRGKLHRILNEAGDVVAEFEDINYARVDVPEMKLNRVAPSARELQLDRTTEEPIAANDDAYDQHYGKMLQWIHYHL